MQKYILFFIGGNPKPEEMQTHMQEWGMWIGKLTQDGKYENGYPYGEGGKKVDANGVSDHAFPEESGGGFMVVKTASLEEAVEIGKEAPHIPNGGYTLVRPCLEMKM
jgi:hypothetical protein